MCWGYRANEEALLGYCAVELGDEDAIVLVQSECVKLVMGVTRKSHMLSLRNHGAWPGR